MTGEDPRDARHTAWSAAAAGWAAHRETFQRDALPVSRWLIDAVAPQPGQTILELAAGPGDTGLLAAELVAPGGRLISSDWSEEMVAAARARAGEMGIDHAEFRVLDAESLDLAAASIDAVLCRWGYMLMTDPGAALGETRRVLRPGGRLALAAWASREENPWAARFADELVARGLESPLAPDTAGPFAWADPARIEAHLRDAGFYELTIEPLDFVQRYESFDEAWDIRLDISSTFGAVVRGLEPSERAAVRAAIEDRLRPDTAADGTITLAARALMAAATA